MQTLIQIRRGEPRDIAWLIAQLEAFTAFYGASNIGIMPVREIAEEKLHALIQDHLLFVAVAAPAALPGAHDETMEGEPIGFIGGLVSGHFFNPHLRQLAELFWWVDPAHRHAGRAGLKLLEEFIAWGKQHANCITFSLLPNSPIKTEHLTRRGFRLSEHSFLMEVA